MPTLPPVAKAAAISSLVLWFGILTFGRLIGYYEGPKDKQASAGHAPPTYLVLPLS